MSPVGGGGAFRRSTAAPDGSCAQRAVTPVHACLTLFVPDQLQSFTLATATEVTVHVHPTEHQEHNFPAIWSPKTALGAWFAAAEASAPAQVVFPSLTACRCCSDTTAAHFCFTHLTPLLQSSPNPAPPAQPEQGWSSGLSSANTGICRDISPCVNESMCAPGQRVLAQLKPQPGQGLLLHPALLPGGQK